MLVHPWPHIQLPVASTFLLNKLDISGTCVSHSSLHDFLRWGRKRQIWCFVPHLTATTSMTPDACAGVWQPWHQCRDRGALFTQPMVHHCQGMLLLLLSWKQRWQFLKSQPFLHRPAGLRTVNISFVQGIRRQQVTSVNCTPSPFAWQLQKECLLFHRLPRQCPVAMQSVHVVLKLTLLHLVGRIARGQ